jgi:phytol kinase
MALVYSYLFVFGIIGASALLSKLGVLNDEGSRKFIHIGVGNWILIALWTFDNVWLALIPPITFVILNYLSYRFDLVKAMEREEKSKSDLGTVYYAISLFVVVLLDAVTLDTIERAVLPILVMAYGDGLSAVIGMHVASPKLVGNKSLAGALTMFVVTLVIGFVLINTLWIVILVAVVATLIELYTPKGLDNLSVPILLYLLLLIL